MATEITSAGYKSLRGFVQTTWTYIELRNESDAPILRLNVSDPRVSWVQEGADVLELKIVVKGTDSEVSLPQTFKSSAIFSEASAGEPLAVEEFSPFTMEAEGDELTVIHQLEIPQVI